MTDFVLGTFFENVSSLKGWPKHPPPKWACLAGKILFSFAQPFCPILDPISAHIRQNPKTNTKNSHKKKSHLYSLLPSFYIVVIM